MSQTKLWNKRSAAEIFHNPQSDDTKKLITASFDLEHPYKFAYSQKNFGLAAEFYQSIASALDW